MALKKVYNIAQFIEEQSEHVAELCTILHELFLSYPNVSCKIRYNIPFYDHSTWLCYISPKNAGKFVELVFLHGLELQQTFPFLEDKGRKLVAGIEINEITDEVLEQVIMVWEEAILYTSP